MILVCKNALAKIQNICTWYFVKILMIKYGFYDLAESFKIQIFKYFCWPKYILLNCNCSDKSTSNNSFLWRCTNNQRKPIFKTALFLLIQLLFSLASGYYGIIQYIRGIGREKSCNFIIYFVVKLNQQVYFAYRK